MFGACVRSSPTVPRFCSIRAKWVREVKEARSEEGRLTKLRDEAEATLAREGGLDDFRCMMGEVLAPLGSR